MAALAALAACSSSHGSPVFSESKGGGSSSGSSSGGSDEAGSSGSSGGAEGGSPSGDDGGGSPSSSSSSGGAPLDTSGWTCPFDTVFGGYTTTCASCVEAMCRSQVQVCIGQTCASCEGPVFSCLSSSCSSACAAGAGSSGAASSGGEGGSSAGACARLASCCPLLAVVNAQYATMCMTTASGGSDSSCQSFATAIDSVAPGVCP